MKRNKFILSLCCLIVMASKGQDLYAQTPKTEADISIIKKVADNILSNTTYDYYIDADKHISKTIDASMMNESVRAKSPYNEWEYWNGVLNIAMLGISDQFNEKEYRDFSINNYAFIFDNLPTFKNYYAGTKKDYYPYSNLINTRILDDCGAMGAGLIEVNQITPRKEYDEYLNVVGKHMLTKQLRLADKTFSRTSPHNMTIWADDLYMSVVFLSRMGKWSGNNKYFDDAILQVENMTKYLYNSGTGLYYHCWYDDLKVNGVAHWGRCNGWVMMAQIELLDHLPANYPRRAELLRILQQQIRGVSRYQDITGMWHQLLDKNDSYLESSCTAMFTYSIAKAVNNGWLDKSYISIALNGWEGVKQNILDDGKVKNICMGTGIENDLVFYYKRPAPMNDIHGLGAILLAGNEILKYKKNNPENEN